MEDVYIVGADMIKFGRYPDRDISQLAAEAAKLALKDAGIGLSQVDALYSGNQLRAWDMVGQRTLAQIGQTGIPVTNVANACATGGTAMREAWMSIRAGVHDVVLVVGVEQLGKGLLGEVNPAEGLVGSASMPAMFSQLGTDHTRKYGTTLSDFAKISVKNHFHSTMNDKAMYRSAVSLEEVMQSEMISYPNTKLMCSVNSDGAACAVLMSASKARALGLVDRAVLIRASALNSNPFQRENLAMPDFNGATQLAVKSAYETAGIGPDDVDLIELHDCFATAELVHYENLGLCEAGGAARLINDGETQLGGRIPVNVSGGLLSKGHPLGATGVANICELVKHLRDEAGARQVEGARIGMAHVVGGTHDMGAACVVHILEKV